MFKLDAEAFFSADVKFPAAEFMSQYFALCEYWRLQADLRVRNQTER